MAWSARWLAAAVVTGALLLSSCTSSGEPEPEDVADAEIAATTTPPSDAGTEWLTLAVIGDSIPFNMPTDCPGCTGFVDRYAAALEEATGTPVAVANLSEHTGLTLEGLVAKLPAWEEQLAEADAIIVAIAHNSSELASEEPCGVPLDEHEMPVWSVVDKECAVAAADKYRPIFESMYAHVAALREGKPTILRTVNRYNDWIGWPEAHLTPQQAHRSQVVLEAWNSMICRAAERNGFGCADIGRAFNGPGGMRPSGDLVGDDYTHPSDKGNAVIARELVALGFAPLA